MSDGSRVIRCRQFRWSGIPLKQYKAESEAHRDVSRQTIMGEGEAEGALAFLTRYFEVQPGGHSTLEYHSHPHAVVILRGSGRVVLGDVVHEVQPYDCIYVAPEAVHQFQATGDEPLGFLCVVDRVRDRPTPVGTVRPPEGGGT